MIEPCAQCHGADDASHGVPLAPIIAGMPAPYIEEAIHAYVDEVRQCVRIQEMCDTVYTLSEAEVVHVAEHYARAPWPALEEEFDTALATEGAELHASRCAICHLRPDDENVEHGLGIPWKFDVVAGQVLVSRAHGRWKAYYCGPHGKRRPRRIGEVFVEGRIGAPPLRVWLLVYSCSTQVLTPAVSVSESVHR